MQNKSLYLIAQFDKKTQDKLTGYYDILKKHNFIGKQTKDIPYHFTFGSCDIDREEQLIHQMDKVCSAADIIEINLSHIGLFGLNVLFIEPNMNLELLTLQRHFFPDCGSGYHVWSAHTTLLMDEPEEILRALPIIAENFKPFKAQIESICLYEFFPARFIKECKLKR